MTAIALKYGATIDKYIGDAMMLFFGDPDTKGEREDARACLKMALAMQERMKLLQNQKHSIFQRNCLIRGSRMPVNIRRLSI